ncbi:maleylpyruvate isomerase family mycothiol-dependent enzyme [Micromonospora sp. CA-240977]|uniref:maleylpyruvate isomerase family mycothiol-dependent enzyme n=1 Tax=Micromonospora sp. CA-240977 TaxID=3239957 RepID=UPI003D92277A
MSTSDLRRHNDERFTDLAAGLTDREWAQPSRCDGWTNQDVLAHLVIGLTIPLHQVFRALVRHGGSFDQANATLARDLAARTTPADLLAEFTRASRKPRGIGRLFPPRLLLGDHVIHELDITTALHREPAIPPDVLAAVLNTEVHIPNPFIPARARAAGLHLHADDMPWEHTRGPGRLPTVTASAADLASALAGRQEALLRCHGDGLAVLRQRMPHRRPAPPKSRH